MDAAEIRRKLEWLGVWIEPNGRGRHHTYSLNWWICGPAEEGTRLSEKQKVALATLRGQKWNTVEDADAAAARVLGLEG